MLRLVRRATFPTLVLALAACTGVRMGTGERVGAMDTPAGALVMAGGALRSDNAGVWQRIVALAGGKGAKFAVFGLASAEPETSARSTIGTLERYGAHGFFVPIATDRGASGDRDADGSNADDERLAAEVRGADGVFFTGGDQSRITRALVDPRGRRTRVLEAVWAVYRRGGVIAGTSAGTAIMSETMFSEPDDDLALLRHGVVVGRDIAAGLGFVGPGLFVDQHCLARGRFARMLVAMRGAGLVRGLCVDEDTAAVVTRREEIEIIGRSGVVAVDLTAASGSITDQGLRLQGARLGLLGPGDRYVRKTGAIVPSAEKATVALGLREPQGGSTQARVFTDVLGRGVLTELLGTLVASRQTEAVGLALDAGAFAMSSSTATSTPATSTAASSTAASSTAASSTGFAFRFARTVETRGYRSDTAALDGYTVVGIRLDVEPVLFAAPLFRPVPP